MDTTAWTSSVSKEGTMAKPYIVRLTSPERGQLEQLVSMGKAVAYKSKHANVLLKVEADGSGWTDERAAEAFRCHLNTVACAAARRRPGAQNGPCG